EPCRAGRRSPQPRSSRGGRMTTQSRPAGEPGGRPFVAGVDVGGTKVAVILVAADGSTLARAVRPMVTRSVPDGIEPIVSAIRAALDAAGTSGDLAAIGVWVPGRVE